jgi:hypothetical protein
MLNDLAICVLSWREHKTLINTLDSYKKADIFPLFAEKLAFFQEMSTQDQEIAKRFKLPYQGTKQNIGIENGWRQALQSLKSKYVLFLENDCELITQSKEAKHQITLAYQNLVNKRANIVRLRHRWQPGYMFEAIDRFNYYHERPLSRILRPRKFSRLVGNAFYKYQNPEQYYPKIFANKDEHGTYFLKSKNLFWTNQSIMFERNWVLDVILEHVKNNPARIKINGFENIENSVNRWWRKQNFTVAVNLGAFTHKRVNTKQTPM